MKKPGYCILTVVLAMVMVLAACGSPATPGTDPANGSNSTDTSTGGSQATNTEGRPVIKHFLNQEWATQEYWGQDEISTMIMDNLGYDIQLFKPTSDDGQQLTLMIASNDLPDIVSVDIFSIPHFKLEKSGLVIEPRPIIDKVAPDFNDYIGEQYFQLIEAEDGKNYCLASCIFTDKIFENDLYAPVGPWNPAQLVREDLWNEFGKPDISTPEGLMNVLLQCKEKYPDIVPFNFNEDLKKTAGINNSPYRMGWIISGFGAQNYYTTAEGKVTAAWNDRRWVEGAKFLSQMYRNGIITEDIFAQDYEQARAKVESGDTFMFLGGVTDIGKIPSGNQDVRYIGSAPLGEMRGMQQTGTGWCSTFFSKNSAVQEESIKYMTYMYSKEGNQLAQWGIEGREWQVESDGLPYYTEDMIKRRAEDYTGFTRETGFRLYYWGINYWDHYMEKNMMTKDPNLSSALELYGPYFGARMDYLSLRVDPDTDEGIILQRCTDYFKIEMVNIVMSDSDDEVVSKIENMKKEMQSIGIEQVEAVWTQRSNRMKEIFSDGYTNGYPKWGDSVTKN